jgi:Ran GTPase-activating protein (RanGAP) involved in mRNA processing and transport
MAHCFSCVEGEAIPSGGYHVTSVYQVWDTSPGIVKEESGDEEEDDEEEEEEEEKKAPRDGHSM